MTHFPNRGFYRGDLDKMLAEARAAFDRLTPEQQTAHRQAQRESWVKGEMGIGNDADEAAAREAFHQRQLEKRDRHAQHYSTGVQTIAEPAPDAIDIQSPLTPRQMGYTGNTCSNCGSTRMSIAGHCEVCADCGTTTGCS